MIFMRKFLWVLCASLALVGLYSCGKDDKSGEKGEETKTVKFNLTLNTVTETSVTLNVTSTGGAGDTYYVFATSDLTTSLTSIINQTVASLGADDELFSGNQTLEISGLTAETKYRAVVVGVKSDAATYGTPVSISFTTSESTSGPSEYTVNDAWKVTYDGTEEYESTLCDKITVTSTSTQSFYTAVISVAAYEKFSSVKEYLEAQIAADKEYVTENGISWSQMISTKTESWYYNLITDRTSEYYAFAIGVSSKGNATGLYAMSEKFTPAEVSYSDDYAKWLGGWNISGKSSGGSTVSFNLTVSMSSPDAYYTVSGWEGSVGDLSTAYDSGKMVFYSQNLGTITVNNGALKGDLCFMGYDATDAYWDGDYDIATATLASGGKSATVTGGTVSSTDGTSAELTGMSFTFDCTDGNLYTFTEALPVFPLTMTKTTTSSVKAVEAVVRPAFKKASGKVAADFRTLDVAKLNVVMIAR